MATYVNGTEVPASPFHHISGGQPWFYLGVYCAAAACSGVCILVRSVIIAFASVASGKKIHDVAMRAVFASPSSFFDVTPIGRIINRFSGDVQKVDVQLSQALSQFVGYIVSLVCTLAILILYVITKKAF